MYAKILKANPYKDEQGRFTSKDKASTKFTEGVQSVAPIKTRDLFGAPREDYDKFYDAHKAHLSALSGAHRVAVTHYSSEGQEADYTNINGYLRGKIKQPDSVKAYLDRKVALLDDAVNVPLGEDVKLYRGLGLDVVKDLGVGDELTDPGFVSTTIRESVARNFGADRAGIRDYAFLKINAAKDRKGVFIKSYSESPSEEEVLLPRNSRFIIRQIRKDDGATVIEVDLL